MDNMEFIFSLEFIDVFPYLVIVVFAVISVTFTYMINLKNFFKMLEDVDPDKYRELSTQKPFGAISIMDMVKNSNNSFQYFRKREYKDLDNESIKELGSRVRWLFFVGFFLNTAVFVVFFSSFFLVPILYSFLS